jgi:hypothetical protein
LLDVVHLLRAVQYAGGSLWKVELVIDADQGFARFTRLRAELDLLVVKRLGPRFALLSDLCRNRSRARTRERAWLSVQRERIVPPRTLVEMLSGFPCRSMNSHRLRRICKISGGRLRCDVMTLLKLLTT